MKHIDELVFPSNLAAILERDGIWADDSFAPIGVLVMEVEYEGEEMVSYQLEISAGDLEEVEAVMEKYGQDADGYGWEDLVREHIHRIDPALEAAMRGDSEGATCVLWVPDAESFREMLGHVLDLVQDPGKVRELLAP